MGMSIEDEREMRANGITNVEIKHIKQLYETRLKADMVAMLEELKKEIEIVPKYCMTHDGICVYRRQEEYISDIKKVIQQKINILKVESEDKE